MFIDQVRIFVQSGNGGKGCVSFRREKYIPKGGPDGGDGGRGGDVILHAVAGPTTLSEVRYQKRYIAKNGTGGQGAQKSGKAGESLIIRVPVGTAVFDDEEDRQVADLVEDGQEFVAARGGLGGQGNQHFATATRQAPRYAQPGLPGESSHLRLELKLLADVGLVGLPNAGKSTLISRISAAHPKVADYPFTTLIPNLGVVNWGEFHSFVMADIPGLVAGAHEGKGLGTRFLRHVERTRYLLLMADATAMADAPAEEALNVLTDELACYGHGLAERPFAVAATKIDAADDAAVADIRKWADRKGAPFFAISAVTGAGLEALTYHLGEAVERLKAEAPPVVREKDADYERIWQEDEEPRSGTQ